MHVDFGSCLDLLSDEMCQMNTKIGCIARLQSRLGAFTCFPSPKHAEKSSSLDGRDNDDDFGSKYDDEMTISQ